MNARSGSIKGRLFIWSLLITSTVLIILGAFLYHEIRASILASVKQTLHAKIQTLKGLLHEEHGMIELELAEVVSGEYSIPRSGHYYKVLLDNDMLAASPSLTDESFDLASGRRISQDSVLRESVYLGTGPANEEIMTVRHDFPILGSQATAYAAQSLEESLLLINRFSSILQGAIIINIVFLALAGLWVTRRSLRPLAQFTERIETITYKTMNERIEPELYVDEIQTVADSFNSMLDRLQGAFEMEKRLVADASHELKTPLSVIKAQCDVLLQRDRSKEEYAGALEKIRKTADTMNSLITDMLSLARLDAGALSSSTFKTLSLNESIDRAMKLAHFLAAQKQITLERKLAAEICVHGDADALTEMFLNILDNAIKYSPHQCSVHVAATREDSSVTVSISDTGRGIAPDDLERVFERFYRADTSRSSEGTGLGLSIARAIAEAHRATIRVTSEPGKGSAFFISFPLVPCI